MSIHEHGAARDKYMIFMFAGTFFLSFYLQEDNFSPPSNNMFADLYQLVCFLRV